MIILHGLWSNTGRFFLWGESSTTDKSHTFGICDGALPHPFACTQQQLDNLLEDLEYEADSNELLSLTLPCAGETPLHSEKVAQVLTEQELEISLKQFSIPAAVLEPVTALSFLSTLTEDSQLGFRTSSSLQFWLEATKLALELLTKGKFIPGISVNESTYNTIWRPVFSDSEDQARLDLLTNEIPQICHSFANESNNSQSKDLVESFIITAIDSLVRIFLRNFELVDGNTEVPRSTYRQAALNWIRALNREDKSVVGTEFDLANLDTKLRRWATPFLTKRVKYDLKTRISIISPSKEEISESSNGHWMLSFAIQDSQDGDNILHASDLWCGRLGFLENSQHSRESLEELLLADIATVGEKLDFIKKSLFQDLPTEIDITTEQAYRFLREAPKLLDSLSIIVGLPKWWSNPASKFGLKLNVKEREQSQGNNSEQTGLLGINSLLDYEWEITVDDKTLGIEEFKKLSQQSSPLVQIGSSWVELDPEQVKATMRFIERQQQRKQLTVMEAIQFGLGVIEDIDVFPVVGFDAGGWIKQLLLDEKRSIPSLEQPKQFKGELRQYQRDGLSWLHFLKTTGIGGCLADDMGLGKTIQLLSLLLSERELEPGKKHLPTLLIVPMSIIDNWHQEVTRFAENLSVYIHHGSQRLVGQEMIDVSQSVDVVLTTYSIAHRDEQTITKVNWGKIVLDEAQNIKNINTKQTQAIRRIGRAQFDQPDRLEHCQRIALTGTPLENHLEELWSIFDFLNPGLLGTLNQFRRKFSVPIERYRNVESAESLSRVVRPFILRRLKSDPTIINDLPEKIEIEVLTQLTPEQSSLYKETLDSMLTEVDHAVGLHRKGLVLATITKLKQICNHPALFLKDESSLANRSGKLQRLEELLEVILAEGDKALVFTQFAQMGHLLKPYLQERFNRDVLYLHGSLTRKAREKVLERFNAPDGPPIFVLSLKAGGFGLNLTQANQVIHYDQWWNPAVQEQATDRAYRIGQTQNVQVRTFICRGTLEDKINELLRHKRQLADQIVGATKNTISEMSTDELRELLQLHSEQ